MFSLVLKYSEYPAHGFPSQNIRPSSSTPTIPSSHKRAKCPSSLAHLVLTRRRRYRFRSLFPRKDLLSRLRTNQETLSLTVQTPSVTTPSLEELGLALQSIQLTSSTNNSKTKTLLPHTTPKSSSTSSEPSSISGPKLYSEILSTKT